MLQTTEGAACLVVAAVFKTVVGLLRSRVGSIPSLSAMLILFSIRVIFRSKRCGFLSRLLVRKKTSSFFLLVFCFSLFCDAFFYTAP